MPHYIYGNVDLFKSTQAMSDVKPGVEMANYSSSKFELDCLKTNTAATSLG